MLETTTKTYKLDERSHIMGILNITPDSFSDGGYFMSVDKAVQQAIAMEQAGADIIDIGGESTRPGHTPLTVNEETSRVIEIIEAVKANITIPISIDTYKAETAKQAIEAGAEIINDIWGVKKDPEMAKVAAAYNVPIILMHNRDHKNYHSLINDMLQDLQKSIDIAIQAGVKEKHIIIDPGIGFAKSPEDNIIVMNELERFNELGYPVLLGTSRKSFIGNILDLPAEERDIGTGATTCLGIIKGACIFRVHNVQINKELALMMDAML